MPVPISVSFFNSSIGVESCHIIVLVVCSSFCSTCLIYSYARNRHISVLILFQCGLSLMLEQEIVQHCDRIINNLNGHRRPFYPSSTDIHSPIQGGRGRRPMKMPHLISPPPSFSHSSGVFNLKLNACKPCSSNSGLSKALTMRCRAMAVLPLNDSDTRWIAKSVSMVFCYYYYFVYFLV